MSKKQVGKYMLDRKVGKGSYAQVWLGHCEDSKEIVAIKVISRYTVNETTQLRQEVAVLRKIDHRNIVRFKDLKKSVGHYYLVLEYCAGGDLAKFIKSHGRVKEASARKFLQQLSEGLLVLHRLSFIHRDLKPQNILMSEASENAVLKIADFGFARSLNPTDMAATVCGSPLYMAPEILRHEKYDARADLWSLGTILYELLYGNPPFSGQNPMQLLATIENSPRWLSLPVEPVLSAQCVSLLTKVLVKIPLERMSPDAFFSHEFNLGSQYETLSTGSPLSIVVPKEVYESVEDVCGSHTGRATPPTDMSNEVICISYDEPTSGRVHNDDLTRVLGESGSEDELSRAVSMTKCGPLTDSYAGTQVALGLLLRCVAKRVMAVSKESLFDTGSLFSDALGVIVRSCQSLENALDHAADVEATKVIEGELGRSTELALRIQEEERLHNRTAFSRPLRWVFSFVLNILEGTQSTDTLEAALLLVDFLESEIDSLVEANNVGVAGEELRSAIVQLRQGIRDRLD